VRGEECEQPELLGAQVDHVAVAPKFVRGRVELEAVAKLKDAARRSRARAGVMPGESPGEFIKRDARRERIVETAS